MQRSRQCCCGSFWPRSAAQGSCMRACMLAAQRYDENLYTIYSSGRGCRSPHCADPHMMLPVMTTTHWQCHAPCAAALLVFLMGLERHIRNECAAFPVFLNFRCNSCDMSSSRTRLCAVKVCTRPWFEWANAMAVVFIENALGSACDDAAEEQRHAAISERENLQVNTCMLTSVQTVTVLRHMLTWHLDFALYEARISFASVA